MVKKTTRKAVKGLAKKRSIKERHDVDIFSESNREMQLHLEALETKFHDITKRLKHEMQSTISSLPNDVLKMTVEEYINSSLCHNKEQTNNKKEALTEVGNLRAVDTPFPSGAVLTDAASAKAVPTPQKKKRKKKAIPSTTRTTRSRNRFETPSKFVIVEGTPMLTRKDSSHLQLTGKPRPMERNDDISALKLTAFSAKGSPMTMENMDEATRLKIQESLRLLMRD